VNTTTLASSRSASSAPNERSIGVWQAAWQRYRSDRVGVASLIIVGLFLALIGLSALGLVAKGWQQEVGLPNAPPTIMGPAPEADKVVIEQPKGPNVDLSSVDPLAPRYKEWEERAKMYKTEESVRAATLPMGGDRLGRDVLSKAIKGTEVSVFVGVLAALFATVIGTLLGAIAGFFGGKVGDFLEWLYNVIEAVPNILLIFAIAAALNQRGAMIIVVILGLTSWAGMYRQVRAEFIKHSSREYVRSAEAIGASPWSRIFKHILPNISHVVLVRMALLVVGCIKAEVILSYLGLGVSVDQVSWGTMLAESQSELILGHWWQLVVATLFMCVFVTAFSLMADAARDALDPKLRGLE
jgi:oligopeptide transport system permease protein